jgi:LPS sulfotransferase NodH
VRLLDRSRGYVICATPRCGSNYLSQLLASTGVLGRPREYFNAPGRRKYDDPDYPDDPRLQLDQVVSTGATSNRVYGVKVHAFQLAPLLEHVDPFAALPRVRAIRLRRDDALGQALSWARAHQTNQHRAGDPPEGVATYDRARIDASLDFLARENAWWDDYLARTGTRVLEIRYEDLEDDPQREVDRVAHFLGVRSALIRPDAVEVTRQRDDLSAAWRERYVAETAETGGPGLG